MRILFFNYEYPPLGGGAANATQCILEEYSKIPDLAVDLVTSSVDANYHNDKIGNNIEIHRIPIGKNSKNLHHQSQKEILIYTWKAYFYSKKLINKNKYDLTHSFFSVPCGFLSYLFWKKHKIPYIVSLRGADVPGYAERFAFIYKFITPLIKLIWKKAEAVVSNSEGLKELALKSEADQKIEIIHNGVNVNNFFPIGKKENNEKFIITPGASRLTSRKGLKYLIRAVHKLAIKYPEIYLKIMGDGQEEKERLEILVKELGIQNQVEFLGRIPREKTAPYYQEADVFVLPSLNEGMSNAMLEALATGLPIISTNTGGAKELIKEDKNGFIIKFRDSEDIAEKIEKLINDKDMAGRMGAESRKIAESLSWENIAKKYYNLYKEIKK
jgi:glycosyltransferase involved in cell wall biosynthesis